MTKAIDNSLLDCHIPSQRRAALRYSVTAKSGEGGIGEMHRARDTERGRDVVLRVLRLALALVVLASGCARSGPSAGVAVEAVTVIDAVNGVRENQRVVTDGDLIVSVTEMGEPDPPTAETLDGRGRFLIPGLWDMHVHFLYDDALTSAMAGLFLGYGITSVRDTGGDLTRMTALRAGLDASDVPAPRVFLSGPLLDGRYVVYDGGDPGRPALGTSVPDAESARQQVRLLKEAGADFIKIYELVEPEVFDVLADEARRQGLPTASHVPLTMTADVAGPLVDSMEHLRNIELACAASWQELLEVRRRRIDEFGDGRGIELRSELHALQRRPAVADFDEARCNDVLDTLRDTTQVPTLRLNLVGMVRTFDRPDWTPALAELPEVVRDRWQARAEQMRHAGPPAEDTFEKWSQFLMSKLKTRGVPVGAGADTPIGLAIPGYALHTELELLVESGLTPLEALHAATVQPARFFGLEAEMGQVQAGMRADLVLLDGDSLANIRNTRRIVNMMSRGKWLK